MDKNVFPVPAGPMPKIRSDLKISSQSFFWFFVLITNFFCFILRSLCSRVLLEKLSIIKLNSSKSISWLCEYKYFKIFLALFELKSSPIIVKSLPLLMISTSYFLATSFIFISRAPQRLSNFLLFTGSSILNFNSFYSPSINPESV